MMMMMYYKYNCFGGLVKWIGKKKRVKKCMHVYGL